MLDNALHSRGWGFMVQSLGKYMHVGYLSDYGRRA